MARGPIRRETIEAWHDLLGRSELKARADAQECCGRLWDPEAEAAERQIVVAESSVMSTPALIRVFANATVILLRPGLDVAMRRCALTEELVHTELSVGYPSFVTKERRNRYGYMRAPRTRIAQVGMEEWACQQVTCLLLLDEADAAEAARLRYGDHMAAEELAAKFLVTPKIMNLRMSLRSHPVNRGSRD